MNITQTMGTIYGPYKKYHTNFIKMYQPNKQMTTFKQKQQLREVKYRDLI